MNTINNNIITALKDAELDCVQGGNARKIVNDIALGAAVTGATPAVILVGNAVTMGMNLWKRIKNCK